MKGIVNNEVAEYINSIVSQQIDVDAVEFIRCVDERAYEVMSDMMETIINRASGQIQMSIASYKERDRTIAEEIIREVNKQLNVELSSALAYGWLLAYLSRVSLDLRRTPSLSNIISATIDAEGDLKKIKENLVAAKPKPAEVSPGDKDFNNFMNTLEKAT